MISLNYKAILFGGATAVLFAGCGGSGDLSDSVISAECDFLFRCAGEDEDTAYDRLEYGTEQACRQSEAGYDITEEYRQFIDDGTVVIDNGAIDRCLSALRATCTRTVAQREACDTTFVGQVADGSGCVDDVQCVSGVCDADGFEECGTCLALIPTNGPCDYFGGDVCVDGPNGEEGYCDFDTELCQLRAIGEELTADAAIGTDCDYEQRCEAGLFCQDGTCARWRTVGERCDTYSDSCAPGTFCLESVDDPDQGTCVEVRIEAGPGEDCGITSTEVVVCDRGAGLYCNDDENGVCAVFAGQVPAEGYCQETIECVEGLECLGGICLGDRLVDGTECGSDGQCQSNNCQQQTEAPFGRVCAPAIVCP